MLWTSCPPAGSRRRSTLRANAVRSGCALAAAATWSEGQLLSGATRKAREPMTELAASVHTQIRYCSGDGFAGQGRPPTKHRRKLSTPCPLSMPGPVSCSKV